MQDLYCIKILGYNKRFYSKNDGNNDQFAVTHSCHKSKERPNTQKRQESIQIKRVKPLQQLVAAARKDEKANPPQLNCFFIARMFFSRTYRRRFSASVVLALSPTRTVKMEQRSL